MDYRHLPDDFSRIERSILAYRCSASLVRGIAYKAIIKAIVIDKAARADARLLLKNFERELTGRTDREAIHAGEKQRELLNAGVADKQGSPDCRRWIAATGERAAIGRRSEIDRSGGLGKPRRVPCHHGDHVATAAATPAENDTQALASS